MDMTDREPGHGRNRHRNDAAASKRAGAKPAPAQGAARHAQTPVLGEEELFGSDPGPRVFGEGAYRSGGPADRGNFSARRATPHGSIGSFDDAGGAGGTELLGQRKPGGARVTGSPSETPKEAPNRKDRGRA
jgi:hypothetical protein